MHSVEKRYERTGEAKPCFLDQEDLLNLSRLIQEGFTRDEVERYFRVSTPLGQTRIFTNSMGDFLVQPELPDKISDLSFWIEGWDRKTRYDKTVLLDFSKYTIQLQVEGTDPVWVYDKFGAIMKFLKSKTVWYWPVIRLEKIVNFAITALLIISLLLAYVLGEPIRYFGKFGLMIVWIFLTFFDTRRICPYSALRLRGEESVFNKENFFMTLLALLLLLVIVDGLYLSFYLK
jgi:hypothetical protein